MGPASPFECLSARALPVWTLCRSKTWPGWGWHGTERNGRISMELALDQSVSRTLVADPDADRGHYHCDLPVITYWWRPNAGLPERTSAKLCPAVNQPYIAKTVITSDVDYRIGRPSLALGASNDVDGFRQPLLNWFCENEVQTFLAAGQKKVLAPHGFGGLCAIRCCFRGLCILLLL